MGTTNILGQRRYRLRQRRRMAALALGLGDRKDTEELRADTADGRAAGRAGPLKLVQ